ncbi:MAG: EF-hand domain-containing protein [Methylibium sp.]|uniref:EF-hand domain-containing protein n=1 Tax=Methylibium sp. TaxID=2067992 RepID=UPI0017E12ED5|nr:EF-hand domain-containing protein [Methylibium sp.]MBA3595952.1 EF-hand domain-containing protein [Methylibium sp.]
MKNTFACLVLCAASTAAFAADMADMKLTAAQIDAAFKVANPDNDGTVDMKEATKFGITKKAFEAANPDKDGTLDKKEFAAAIAHQFKQANPDNDGTLDPKEAKAAGIKSQKVFEAANPDKDGTLDIAEYLVALTNQAK